MEKIEKLKQNLIQESPANFKKEILEGIELAEKYHKDQTRYSGDPFITHALNTAITLAQMKVETATILGGLLHNSITNSPQIKDQILNEITEKLNEDIASLIEKTNEINKATASTDTEYEIITKYILNSNKDLRPILIKLADTLDNVRTIEYMPSDRLNSKLQKIFHIYAPLAEYLNLDNIKKELEERAFEIYRRDDCERIEEAMNQKNLTEEYKDKYLTYFNKLFSKLSSKPGIYGRVKSKYSVYNKLKKHLKEGLNLNLDYIRDLLAFRIIVSSEDECFKALELIIDCGEIITSEFDDYITHPKPNGYSALQGPAIFKDISDNVVEIQIMTPDMYYHNTYGPASHIAYKESKSRYAKPTDKYNWVEEVHKQINRNIAQREDQISIPMNVSIFEENIYAFTPKGKIIQLDKGDTVVDFAFRVHSDIGYSMVSAKVNGKPVKLDYPVQTGDTVEIKTQLNKTSIKPEWLKYANSSSTQYKIQRAWKKQ